jgi:hypothetical protein
MTVMESNQYIYRFLTIPISNYFISVIEEYNAIFGQQQIEVIYHTISMIENKQKIDKIDYLIKINIQKCIQWCMKHNIDYHNFLTNVNTNIFLSEEISV